ncbi:BACON domain-containing protein [Embleya sp. AB8]|uniref:BACON domain-containing protein n=1 Tax=Embleya sp. AB8 TaxID=3156304 RepID=UPI003C750905
MAGGDGAVRGPGTTDVTGAVPDAVALYDAYGDALFGFCLGLVHDSRVAARAVRDTLAAAPARIRAVREPSRTRALLYALARAECARAAGARSSPGVVEEMLAAGGAGRTGPDRHRLPPLVPYALWAVDEVERIALDLSARHRLGGAELADVLALSERRVARVLGRGREQFEQALAIYAVATHARRDCPELALLLPDAGAAVEPGLRQPLHLHVDSCPDCVLLRPGPVDGRELLAARVLPVAPDTIRTGLLAGSPGVSGEFVGRDGFPPGAGRARSRVPVVVACTVGAALVVGPAVVLRSGGADGGASVAIGSARPPDQPVAGWPPPTPSTPASSASAAAAASATASSLPSSVPSSRTTTPKPTARTGKSARPSSATGPAAASTGSRPRSGGLVLDDAATPGTLGWSRTSVDLAAGGGARTIRLSATGGPVTWSLGMSENDWLTVSPSSGTLANGQSISITISANVDRAPAATWAVTVSANPGGIPVEVRGGGRRVDVR